MAVVTNLFPLPMHIFSWFYPRRWWGERNVQSNTCHGSRNSFGGIFEKSLICRCFVPVIISAIFCTQLGLQPVEPQNWNVWIMSSEAANTFIIPIIPSDFFGSCPSNLTQITCLISHRLQSPSPVFLRKMSHFLNEPNLDLCTTCRCNKFLPQFSVTVGWDDLLTKKTWICFWRAIFNKQQKWTHKQVVNRHVVFSKYIKGTFQLQSLLNYTIEVSSVNQLPAKKGYNYMGILEVINATFRQRHPFLTAMMSLLSSMPWCEQCDEG